MARDLYLFERIDVIGQGAYAYMEHLKKDPVLQMPDMFKLQGTFYVVGITGRWPEVINIWDVPGGWDGWYANVDRLNLKRRKAFYGEWWDQAAQWRTGGLDRLCGAAPGSPTTPDLVARGVKGTLFLSELLTVRPGSQLEYLAAVVEQRVPVMREYGHEATGMYEVLSNQHEVVVVWATSIAAQTRLRANRDTTRGLSDDGSCDDRLVAWEQLAATYVTGGDSRIMTPLPGTVYGPDDWEEASLSDWLHPPA